MHVEDGSLPFQSFHLFNSAVKKWYDYTNCSHTLYRLSSQYLIPQESVTQNQDSHNRKQKMYTCKLVLSLSWACIEQESTIIANAAFITTFSRIFTLLLRGALLVISHGHPVLFPFWNTRCIKANGNHRSNFVMVCWINIQSKAFLTTYFI